MSGDGIKILIAGGGTGGHFFSGVAVGEAVLARHEDNSVVYVGTQAGIEARVGPELGLDVRYINISGIKGKGLMAKLKAVARIPLSLFQSMALILKERPGFVVGVGGYASGPLVLAARLLGRKTGVVEQNSVAGVTNRILGKVVHKVFIAFEPARSYFPPHKVVLSGNPIREGVVQLLTLESTGTVGVGNRFKLLVLGGSQGSRAVNEAMMEMASVASPDLKKALYIVHQTGKADVERVKAAYEAAGVQAEVTPFIEAMAEAYRVADLVVCRSGALTVSELTISRRASLLIPFPYATDNHQEVNAQTLVEAEAGELLLEKDLSGAKLVDVLTRLNGDRKSLQKMAWNAGANAKPAAAAEVVDEMYKLIGRP